MCGLVGVFSKMNRNAGQYAFELYSAQKSRGQRGYGYLAIKDGYVIRVVRGKTESDIKSKLQNEKADAILFHHRLPTSTDNSIGTTHPIYVSNNTLDYDWYVAHNGIITNTLELHKKHNDLGYVYTTEHTLQETSVFLDGTVETMEYGATKFNDSECLAIEIARYVEGLSNSIETTGSVAFWAVAVDKTSRKIVGTYFGKNYGRDLSKKESKKWFTFSSETGTPLDALKMYSLNIEDFTLENYKLEIRDTAEPVSHKPYYGYGNHYGNRYGYRQEYQKPTKVEYQTKLEDKEYTYTEFIKTGRPTSDFDHIWVGASMVYVPKEFAEARRLRAMKNTTQLQLPEPEEKEQYSEKAVARLEELALEFAIAEEEMDEVEDLIADGTIDYEEYSQVKTRTTNDIQVATDLMSCLGLPQWMVDEALEKARDARTPSYELPITA